MSNNKVPILTLIQIKEILKPQFEYLAKSRGEMLWLHSFSVWAILSKLTCRIPRFTDRERVFIEIAALIHDIGKMRKDNQELLKKGDAKVLKHTATKDEIRDYLLPFISDKTIPLEEKDIEVIWEFALHHYISDKQQKESQVPAYGIYAEVVRYADWLSSMSRLDMGVIREIQNTLKGICSLTTFGVGRYPSATTYYLIQYAIERYRELGWDVLVVFDDAVVFIGDVNSSLPSCKEISRNFANKIIEKSFEGMSIQNKYMRYELLSGAAKENPLAFLYSRQKEYKDKLSDIEQGPVLFFRTLIDLYKNARRLNSKTRNQKLVLDILAKAGGTNGITQAKQVWNERRKQKDKEWPSTNELIIDIFNTVNLGEICKGEDVNFDEQKLLKDMKADELFNILIRLADKWFGGEKSNGLEDGLAGIISMEEEVDFEKIAREGLKRYKAYKGSRRPTKAICEQCGFTIPIAATSSLNFPESTGFSQINPRPESDAPRIVCPLCVFDVATLRQKVSRNKSQVYVRVTSRIPELWQLYGDLRIRIDRLRQSLTNVREIKKLSETEFSDLPLPSHFNIPIQSKYKDYITEIPLHTERGTLFPVEKVDRKVSPKDLRAKYLAFYALLNLLGLEVHIGLEEQEGLFGEDVFMRHKSEWQDLYFRGLVIVLLANARDRKKKLIFEKKNRFIFIQYLLDRSPSVILNRLEEVDIKKKEFLEKIVSFLMKANLFIIKEKGGEYRMKELLKDAAFFAEGVPKFFWQKEDYDSWRKGGSKYVITKPVDKVLNALLQGSDFEEAFGKFLSELKEDISSDKTKEGSKATVDVKDLKDFAEEAKKIFRRYAELKEANISRFIQAKNGLRSAIYIIKRYENLKEVIKDEVTQ